MKDLLVEREGAPARGAVPGLNLAAATAAALGGGIMTGRWTDIGPLHMQFNAALALFLAGAALFSAARPPLRRLSLACALLCLLVSGATGLQYLTGADFGLDRLFGQDFSRVRAAYPGRMAPNTTLCFVLLSAGLLAWHLVKDAGDRLNAAAMAAVAVILISAAALAGHAMDIEAGYSWWGLGDMAPRAALGLFALGAGLFCLVMTAGARTRGAPLRAWMPWLVASGGIVVSLLVVQGLSAGDRANTREAVRLESYRLARFAEVKLENGVAALLRMSDRWNAGPPPVEKWKRDAQNYIADNAAYRSLALMDGGFRVYASVLRPGEKAPPAPRGALVAALRKAQRQRTPFVFEKPAAGGAALFYFPLYAPDGRPGGFLAAAYDVAGDLSGILKPGYNAASRVQVSDGEGLIFSSPWQDAEHPWSVTHAAGISFRGLEWTVRVTHDAAGTGNGGLIFFIFAAGVGLSLSMASVLRQANRAQRSDKRLESILDNMVDGLITIDEAGIVMSYNKACEKIFGYRADEVAGRNIKMLMPQSYASRHDDYLANYKATGKPKVIGMGREVSGRRKDGTVFPVDLSVAEVKIGSTGRIFSGIVRDITERQHYENDLRRSNAELEKFAYVASHDLKAPLRNIDDLAKWVVEDTAGLLPADANDKLALLRERIAGLERLLDDILGYSRAGRVADPPARVDVHELAERLIETHVPRGFTASIAGRLPMLVTARTPLEQVLGNLISNAVKHHDSGAGKIEISAREGEGFYEFAVRDDGPGIAPEFHARVFEMFQTLKSRDATPGSGLGLAIVKKLVEGQDGRCWIVSDGMSRGTGIHFTWPHAAPA